MCCKCLIPSLGTAEWHKKKSGEKKSESSRILFWVCKIAYSDCKNEGGLIVWIRIKSIKYLSVFPPTTPLHYPCPPPHRSKAPPLWPNALYIRNICRKYNMYFTYESNATYVANATISMKRPDSWDDYCALNALTFFRGTKI